MLPRFAKCSYALSPTVLDIRVRRGGCVDITSAIYISSRQTHETEESPKSRNINIFRHHGFFPRQIIHLYPIFIQIRLLDSSPLFSLHLLSFRLFLRFFAPSVRRQLRWNPSSLCDIIKLCLIDAILSHLKYRSVKI